MAKIFKVDFKIWRCVADQPLTHTITAYEPTEPERMNGWVPTVINLLYVNDIHFMALVPKNGFQSL